MKKRKLKKKLYCARYYLENAEQRVTKLEAQSLSWYLMALEVLNKQPGTHVDELRQEIRSKFSEVESLKKEVEELRKTEGEDAK